MKIKHGPVHQFRKRAPTHLEPIKNFITKGVADLREKIVLHPKRCDIKGAKRHNPMCCVVARTGMREYDLEAISVGRTFTWLVQRGVGIRCTNPQTVKKLIAVFDEHGVAGTMPIELFPVYRGIRMGTKTKGTHKKSSKTRRSATKKIGVRAIGGGVTA